MERRKHKRTDVPYRCAMTRVKDGDMQLASLINISAGGIQLCAPEKFRDSEIIHLRFSLPEQKKTVDGTARIIWQFKSEEDRGNYLCGLQFLDIAPATKPYLKKYLRKPAH